MRYDLSRYRKIVALADEPTPLRRLIAASVAGALAFALTYLLLGFAWGAGADALPFFVVAVAVAAAIAAATTRRAMAVVYGILGAIWLLFEAVLFTLSCIAAALG